MLLAGLRLLTLSRIYHSMQMFASPLTEAGHRDIRMSTVVAGYDSGDDFAREDRMDRPPRAICPQRTGMMHISFRGYSHASAPVILRLALLRPLMIAFSAFGLASEGPSPDSDPSSRPPQRGAWTRWRVQFLQSELNPYRSHLPLAPPSESSTLSTVRPRFVPRLASFDLAAVGLQLGVGVRSTRSSSRCHAATSVRNPVN